jgi:hypothetical protein
VHMIIQNTLNILTMYSMLMFSEYDYIYDLCCILHTCVGRVGMTCTLHITTHPSVLAITMESVVSGEEIQRISTYLDQSIDFASACNFAVSQRNHTVFTGSHVDASI